MGYADLPSKGIGAHHQCSRGNEPTKWLGGSSHWPAAAAAAAAAVAFQEQEKNVYIYIVTDRKE